MTVERTLVDRVIVTAGSTSPWPEPSPSAPTSPPGTRPNSTEPARSSPTSNSPARPSTEECAPAWPPARSNAQFDARDQTVVLAWRRGRGFGYPDPLLPLKGLRPGAVYREAGTDRHRHGAILTEHGLDPRLDPEDHTSTMIRLEHLR